MPVVFIFSAMVSGIAARDAALHAAVVARKETIDMRCVDTVARYLFYTFIIDFSLEMLDLIHRIYESDESSAAWISWSTPSCTCRISWSRSFLARSLPLRFLP
jgi:hypothetical protein